jgi:PII-like signaling protein
MRLTGPVRRVTIYVDEGDRAPHTHKPLYCEIVHRAHEAGLAGATAHRGVEGFGASRQVHVNRILSLSPDLPVAVVIVDTPERIDAFLPQLQQLVTDGLITVDDLRAVGPRAHRAAATEDPGAPENHPGRLRWPAHHRAPVEGPTV